jgi:signal transduction histidine kinase
MRKYLVITFLFANLILLKAQPVIPDSIRYALQNSPVDSHYVKKLITAIVFLQYSHPDSAKYYADSALKLSQQIEYDNGIIYSYVLKAECYFYQGAYSESIRYIYEYLSLSRALHHIDGIVKAYGQLSQIYSELGDHRKALEYQLQKMELVTPLGFKTPNDWFNPPDSSTEYFYNYNLGQAYLNMKMVDSALYFGKKAFLANNQWSAIPILMGDIYLEKGDYTNALKYYNTHTTDNYSVDTVKNYIGKARVFKMMQQEDSCRDFALKALDIARRIKFAKSEMHANELLSYVYEHTDLKESLKYVKISNEIRDSLYNAGRVSLINNIVFNDELRRLDAIAAETAARNKYKIWSLFGIMTTLLITGILLWRNNQQKKTANVLLQRQKEKVESALSELKQAQAQLIQSEKMASLGELTAGIAHEIQNPLNFVNNFSELNAELVKELTEAGDKGNMEELREIAKDVVHNLEKIAYHGKRADAIVKGMLQHSQASSGEKEPADLNALAHEYLRLALYGLRAKDKNFNASLKTDFDPSIGRINIIPQDIGRVLLNLYNNAFFAVAEKKSTANGSYEPMVSITTEKMDDRVCISVKDNGTGIPQKIVDKIFQPFFTTKPTGQGTGLGLSLSYDIIKAHGGEIKVETKEGEGTTFRILLPI